MTPYYAAMTRRWHTNEHLSHTVDPVGFHGGRMAILALMFWPECGHNSWLLQQCVTHDLGEYVSGDIPFGADNKDHEAEAYHRCDMRMDFGDDDPRLKFLDQLDAYLWANHHAPHVIAREDWQKQRNKILDDAFSLGVVLSEHGINI